MRCNNPTQLNSFQKLVMWRRISILLLKCLRTPLERPKICWPRPRNPKNRLLLISILSHQWSRWSQWSQWSQRSQKIFAKPLSKRPSPSPRKKSNAKKSKKLERHIHSCLASTEMKVKVAILMMRMVVDRRRVVLIPPVPTSAPSLKLHLEQALRIYSSKLIWALNYRRMSLRRLR